MLKKSAIFVVVGGILVGCTTVDPYTGQPQISNTAGGAAIGAAVGAIGGTILSDTGSGGRGALIGAGVGALSGGVIGNYMDRQQAELAAQLRGTGVSLARNGNQIVLNMPGNVTFNTNQDSLKAQFFPVLNSVGLILKKYNKSTLTVSGFTDSTGTYGYNMGLSHRRAFAVAEYLRGQGVAPQRLLVQAYGPAYPIASNATPEGRSQNRRVEIQITPLRDVNYY
ncbi:OmpA family protein [Bartonella sp. DGB2]|uniref:OmpA family protein n=1 Tax=Bartonella sp. DGB2 TaxID=3388426 RepID=UPI0039902470